MNLRFLLPLCFGVIGIYGAASSQELRHFDPAKPTGQSSTMMVLPSVSAPQEAKVLETGDELAVVTPDGLVVGVGIWQPGRPLVLSVWQDDDQTPHVDGFTTGDTVDVWIWDRSRNRVLRNLELSFSSEKSYLNPVDVFQANEIYALKEIHQRTQPPRPALFQPATNAPISNGRIHFSWSDLVEANSYQLQVSRFENFSSPRTYRTDFAHMSLEVDTLASEATYYWRVRAANQGTVGPWSRRGSLAIGESISAESNRQIPAKSYVDSNYPNPFNSATTIAYGLTEESPVYLEIFDSLGRKVDILIDGESRPAGHHQIKWDASHVPSGHYFYRIRSGSFVETQRMILAK